MHKLIFLLSGALACGPVFASSVCNKILSTAEFEDYVEGVAALEVTMNTVHRAESVMLSAVAELEVLRGREGALMHQGTERMTMVQLYAQMAMGAYAKGWFKLFSRASDALNSELEYLLDAKLDSSQVARDLARISLRRDVEDGMSMAPFLYQGKDSVEKRFLMDLYTDQSGHLSFGPLEMELTKQILQFGNTIPGDAVLDLQGRGITALSTLKYYLPSLRYVSAHVGAPREGAVGWAASKGIFLTSANFRLNRGRGDLLKAAGKSGNYQIVAGLDIFDDALPTKALRDLVGLIRPHGFLIFVNNYGREPAFTADDARAVGFEVVRWATDRRLPPGLRRSFGDAPAVDGEGLLRAYVLRRGPENPERVPMSSEREWSELKARRPERKP